MSSRSFVHVASVATLALACGGSEAPRTAAIYTAEQLNTLASTPPLVDMPGGAENASEPRDVTPTSAAPPSEGTARVRVIHASPDAALNRLAVYLDHRPEALINPASFRHDTGYRDVPAGEHTFTLRGAAAAGDSAPALAAPSTTLAADHAYTVVVHGVSAGEPHLSLASADDDATRPEAGHARLRFFHALAGVGAVDVCLAGLHPTAVFANVAYGAWAAVEGHGGYFTTGAGHPVTLQIRAQNATVCTGRVLGTVVHTLVDRSVATAVAIGQVLAHPGPHDHAEPRQLLVCTDVPAPVGDACTPVAIR